MKMPLTLTVIFSVLLFATSVLANEELAVVLLPQTHGTKRSSPENIEKTVASQLAIFHYLKDHPNSAVFVEGLTNDIHTEHEDSETRQYFQKKAMKVFPTGLPTDPTLLSEEQKVYIMEKKGAYLAYDLGYISSLFAVISQEKSKEIASYIIGIQKAYHYGGGSKFDFEREVARNYNFYEGVVIERELEAIRHIEVKRSESQDLIGKTPVLVFGAKHDFIDTHVDYPQLKLKIPDGFALVPLKPEYAKSRFRRSVPIRRR